LSVIDLFSSFVLTRPLRTKKAEEVALELYGIFMEWGPPRVLQSDGGSEFVNRIVKEICKLAKVDFKVSTPYYKHSTGSIERLNGTVSASLKKMLEGAMSQWDTMLPLCTHFYNTTVRSLTKSSPYAIMFTHQCNNVRGEELMIDDIDFNTWTEMNDISTWFDDHKQRLEDLKQSHKRVIDQIYPAIKENIQNKRHKTASHFAKSHKIVPSLKVGTKVLVLDSDKSGKRDQNWVGPYRVTQIHPTGTYQLTNDLNDSIRKPISHIKVVPEDSDDEGKSYEVEKIVSHRKQGHSMRYLVKWKGYPHSQNSWLTPDKFDDDKIIQLYWAAKAPKRATAKSQSSKRA